MTSSMAASKFELPTLFKVGSGGKTHSWRIWVEQDTACALIITEHGQVDGKMQLASETIWQGKNIGKANETTPYEQACSEAQSKWAKKKDKSYVEDVNRAVAKETDAAGGIDPMLAHVFAEQGKKINFPCAVQPKLDGIRCIAVYEGGEVSLWSRSRKPITSVPHILTTLKRVLSPFGDERIVLDGELYNHKFKDNFEHIVHLVKQQTQPDQNYKDVEYHIYDFVSSEGFETRNLRLKTIFDPTFGPFEGIELVETAHAKSLAEATVLFEKYLKLGYEGAMLRNFGTGYENKRSYNLQKMKLSLDSDYPIIGIDEGSGKLEGKVGAFVCQLPSGAEFRATPAVTEDQKKLFFENHSLWLGKLAVVAYQNLTSAGVPRFPRVVRIIDKEE